MSGYVTCKTITQCWVFREMGRWYRVTKSWDLGLRPTKGWKKLTPIKQRTEWVDRHHLPNGWKRGYSRSVTNAR